VRDMALAKTPPKPGPRGSHLYAMHLAREGMFYLIGMDAACIYVCRTWGCQLGTNLKVSLGNTTGMWGDGRDDGDGRGWL
jgi:hypothetical protein